MKSGVLALLFMLPGAGVAAESEEGIEYFGVIDIAAYRHPQFVYDEPHLGLPEAAGREPIYLHVPRAHAKQWQRFCNLYRACDRPAWFVSEEWYYGSFLGKARSAEPEPGALPATSR